jgi:hypothetical protein
MKYGWAFMVFAAGEQIVTSAIWEYGRMSSRMTRDNLIQYCIYQPRYGVFSCHD